MAAKYQLAHGYGWGGVLQIGFLLICESVNTSRDRLAWSVILSIHNVHYVYGYLQVTPFSRWERELPKLQTDPRWAALPIAKERRAAFEEFCKNSAEEGVRRGWC